MCEISVYRAAIKACLLAIFVFHPVWADDTEIFFNTLSAPETQPNILFLLDASESMVIFDCANGVEEYHDCGDGTPDGSATRIDRMISAMTEVLDSAQNVNVGMMRFGGFDGGRMLIPVTDINSTGCADGECVETVQIQATIASSDDDAFEDTAGSVHTTETYLPLMNAAASSSRTAVRFSDVSIPQGATIEGAEIVFTSQGGSVGNTDLQFRIEDTGNSQPFVNGSSNAIGSRQWSSESVDWNFDAAWVDNEPYQSEQLTSLISRVVNRPDWCGGNALSLEVTGTGDRQVNSFDSGDGAPVLKVRYNLADLPEGGGCVTQSATLLIHKSNGDAFETLWDGQVKTGANIMHVRNDHMSGWQFEDVPLDSSAKVISANLLVLGAWRSANTGSLDMNLAFEDSGNPEEFSSSVDNLSERTRMAGVSWKNVPYLNNNRLRVESPDISAELQAILAKPDWAEGNSVSLLATHESGDRRAFLTYDTWRTHNAAQLNIVYQSNIQTVNADVLTRFQNEMAEMEVVFGTPTVGALEEAMNYFAGNEVIFGKKRAFVPDRNAGPHSRVSSASTYTGGYVERGAACTASNLNSVACASEVVLGNPVYRSPIKQECQANHVVVLTDGQPSQDYNLDHEAMLTRISNLAVGGAPCTTSPLHIGNWKGRCGEELVDYMAKTDFSDLPGVQNITTHTVGFNLKSDWIKVIAELGGGEHHTAETTEELVAALSDIVAVASDTSATFVAPATTVDQYSRIAHREDVYFALFKPGPTASWQGNLKSYRLRGDPEVGVYGVNGLAVNSATGGFLPTAKSYWSTVTDGDDTALGGAASLLNPNSRNIVTYIDGEIENLISSGNKISIDNPAISNASLGAAPDTSRDVLIDWLAGYDVKDEDEDGSVYDYRYHIGDPLHSSPVLVTYDDDATGQKGDSVVYVGTNEGFLHAFNIGDGSESFAYMPYELLPNVSILYQNQSIVRSTNIKPYGMDGDLTLWTNDANGNGLIEDGDVAYMIAGMRRGGKNYYALDVSDRDNPKFKWKIIGGTGDFSELGQTWSKPITGKIESGNEIKDVLIFAGGYDPSQDLKATRSGDSIGRAIYIVDVESGELIWSGGPDGTLVTTVFSDMKYSIPSDLTIVKDDATNFISQLYVGDMGGQIWRFDINNGQTGNDLVSGGVIANLADDDASGNRRFYHSPDLSLSLNGRERILNIGIGSGYHAHPLDRVIEDKFFMFQYPFDKRDPAEYGFKKEGASEYKPIALSDLFDTTDNKIKEGTGEEIEEAKKELAEKPGWFISMEHDGEKILGAATTLDFVVKFVSYVPQTQTVGCAASVGNSFYYAVNLLDGSPYDPHESVPESGEGQKNYQLTKESRKRIIPSEGLAPAINTVFVAKGNGDVVPVDMSGTNVLQEWDGFESTKRWYWSEYPE